MKRIVLILTCFCFSVGLIAQTEKQEDGQFGEWGSTTTPTKFKPNYVGTSMDVGFMFMPKYGTAYYMAPKLRFQATPRLFVNTGISVIQYNFKQTQMKFDTSEKWAGASPAPTSVYVFTEGVYLLNERWSLNGSAMKNVTPQPLRNVTPFRIPNEAMHLGVDFKVTPNVTVGARVGYSSN